MTAVSQRRLKVLFVIGTLETGGAERQMINLAAALSARGHDTSIAVLDGPGALEALAETKEVALHRLYERSRPQRGPLGLLQLARRLRPDVVHPYLPKDNARVTLLKPWLKPARLVWGVRASDVDLSQYPLRSRVLWPIACRLSARSDLIIANSWAGAEYHVEAGYPADRVRVVPNGIDTNEFRPDPDAGRLFRKALGIPIGTPVVGLLGRFDPMKGQSAFLEILARVLLAHPDCLGLLVGAHTAAQRSNFMEQAGTLGIEHHVVVADRTTQPAAMLNAIDVLALPSVSEGFPNVVAEAMACGTPCVAYDVGDAARVINDPQLVVARGSTSAFAEAVIHTLAEPPPPEDLRQTIIGNFAQEANANESERLLYDLVGLHGGRI